MLTAIGGYNIIAPQPFSPSGWRCTLESLSGGVVGAGATGQHLAAGGPQRSVRHITRGSADGPSCCSWQLPCLIVQHRLRSLTVRTLKWLAGCRAEQAVLGLLGGQTKADDSSRYNLSPAQQRCSAECLLACRRRRHHRTAESARHCQCPMAGRCRLHMGVWQRPDLEKVGGCLSQRDWTPRHGSEYYTVGPRRIRELLRRRVTQARNCAAMRVAAVSRTR